MHFIRKSLIFDVSQVADIMSSDLLTFQRGVATDHDRAAISQLQVFIS